MLGVTGTGGSGKSSLTDELIRRFRLDQEDKLSIAVLAVDPTRRRGGGALLGDRIRMNAIDAPQVYFRSLATRNSGSELPRHFPHVVAACAAAGFDLVIAETPGIGQGDAAVTEIADVSLYVMTPEYGASSQLEKIDMLELADVVAINKFDRRGADDAFRQVCRQWSRDHRGDPTAADGEPVFGTVASRFNDDGTTALFHRLKADLVAAGLVAPGGVLPAADVRTSTRTAAVVPPDRHRYLAEIASTVRGYHATTAAWSTSARRAQQVDAVAALADERHLDAGPLRQLAADLAADADPAARDLLEEWWRIRSSYVDRAGAATTSDDADLAHTSLAGTLVPRVALPRVTDHGELVRWLRAEHLPGHFPFTAGVFPFKRAGEDPARMFAGEGDAFRTNRRFHLLAERAAGDTPVDGIRLGDPLRLRPGRAARHPGEDRHVGRVDRHPRRHARPVRGIRSGRPVYLGLHDHQRPGAHRPGHVPQRGRGPAPRPVRLRAGRPPTDTEEAEVRADVLRTVRGTVQADILKEDQGQNTCIFSTEFSLGMMADMQEWFIEHEVRNFYSVSISGYHIAEAGANPITQLAFTLANGFTYVESYLARGMDIDDFAPNFSFFFSNGMDPEYTVIGRVARRDLGHRHEGAVRRQRAVAETQVPHPDLRTVPPRPGDGLQRHPDDAPGAVRHLRQRQQPPHQCLRRGRDHADARVGPACAGHPDDHHQGVGSGPQREPAPGQLHRGGTDRSARGGRAGRAGPDQRAGRRARGHGARVPARPHPGRLHAATSTASTTAPCPSSG